jgi:cysteine desulfurase family protein (TIGR01976 family)
MRTSKNGAASHRNKFMSFDLAAVRSQFPALALTDDGTRRIYFDNPGGTQVPIRVADAVADCLLTKNANIGAYFRTSEEAGAVVQSAREAMADFLNAPASSEIIFGQNMTTITLHLSRSIGRLFSPGDEIVLSRMDHDANIGPWLQLARDLELEVRWLPFSKDSFEFDLTDLDEILSERTRLVCVGGASNMTGTINDVATICAKAKAVGALTYIDGVQSAPHIPIDVQQLDCDFFVCSPYKFFGPHQGVLWGRREVLEGLEPYKPRALTSELPWCFESGTQSHEGLAGVLAAVEYFAEIGRTMASDYLENWSHFSGRRQQVHAAMELLFDYEKTLAARLIDGLTEIDAVTIQGISDRDAEDRRVPTVSFTHESISADEIAEALAKQNIYVWSGDFYAVDAARTLGVSDTGGTLRVGPVHYNSIEEIDELLQALRALLRG